MKKFSIEDFEEVFFRDTKEDEKMIEEIIEIFSESDESEDYLEEIIC